jgi:Protein of unknown function (DUF2833)
MDWPDHWQGEADAMKVSAPTEERVLFVAENLRQEDADEVMLSNHVGPYEAVFTSWSDSEVCHCIEDDGVPLALIGVTPGEAGGLIWMLATPGLFSTLLQKIQFLREGAIWVELMLDDYDFLYNWVYSKNVRAIKLLRWLGFTIDPPAPHGPSAALFHFVHRRRQCPSH